MVNKITLITGGAGFIGTNLAQSLLMDGERIRIYDNLSRRGTEKNLAWLTNKFGKAVEFMHGDIRDFSQIKSAMTDVHRIFHLAAQVAVTTSVDDPRTDFETNALGTLNVLEAARQSKFQPIILFTSTNKVYGALDDLPLTETDKRYILPSYPQGISEVRGLDFHSPYGCSKGTADQYVHDYGRIYDLLTVVFRMSCIYGIHQHGNEDQGWVAHFILSAIKNKPITIFGNGKQVRDLLWVEDLVDVMKLATNKIDITAGSIFNVGGGVTNSISIWLEFEEILFEITRKKIDVNRGPWRPGDQLFYVTDNSKISKKLDWSPSTSVNIGLERLYRWALEEN